MKFKESTLHETENRSVVRTSRVNAQRRIPSRSARPFREALPPVFRHKPLPVFDQATVAPTGVTDDTAGAPNAEFAIADQVPVIGEQICDSLGLLVPRDCNAMSPDVYCCARIMLRRLGLTLPCSTACAHNVRRDLGSNHRELLRLGTCTQEQNTEQDQQPNRMRMDSQSGASLQSSWRKRTITAHFTSDLETCTGHGF